MRALLAVAFLACASSASAQTLVLCEADWIDAERVQALVTVEVEPDLSLIFRVRECTSEGAAVEVVFAGQPPRSRMVRFGATAPEARSRLVALVLVELARLGAPWSEAAAGDGSATTASETPPADEPPPSASLLPAAEPEASAELDPEVVPDPTAPATESGSALEGGAAPGPVAVVRQRFDPEVPPRAEPTEAIASCDRPVLRTGRSPCSWTIGFAVGLAGHQLLLLGRQRSSSLGHPQLRLRARWRFLLLGVRALGLLSHPTPDGGELTLDEFTALAGVEFFTRSVGPFAMSLSVVAEAGAARFEDRSVPFCFDAGCVGPTGETAGRRPVYGLLGGYRIELQVRRSLLALDLEAGWLRGVAIEAQGELITGVGGLVVSASLEVGFGRGERR